MGDVVVMTDFGSTEGSRAYLGRAAKMVTGRAPAVVDARRFYDGGDGRLRWDGSTPIRELPDDGVCATASRGVFQCYACTRGTKARRRSAVCCGSSMMAE